jgi:excisionase family DNA binding protein
MQVWLHAPPNYVGMAIALRRSPRHSIGKVGGPAKRRETFNAPMVHHLLIRASAITPRYRRRKPQIASRQPDEWTIHELAEQIGVPEPTLYTWVQKGRLRSRIVKDGRTKLVHADAAAIAELKAIRATPAPWRRLPPPFIQPINPTTES